MSDLEKALLGCIDLSKLSKVLVEQVIVGSLAKVVAGSNSSLEKAIFAEVSPIFQVEVEKFLADEIAKIGV